MEDIIKDMIEKAVYYKDELGFIDEAYDLISFTRELINDFANTINCPSNWRDIGEKLANEYSEDSWVFENLELWNHVNNY